jgi:hypothetical protein
MRVFEDNEGLKIFRCPACREYIDAAAERCRFCQTTIEPEAARTGVRQQKARNKLERKKDYSTHLYRGGAFFLLGLLVMAATYYLSEAILGTEFVWFSRFLIVGGGADFLYGVFGLLSERTTD